ncbi:MAG: flagellar assembly protein FliH [Deltaproteobacteria bacterium]|nr:flagellar assembly protein FliH [Deltaproteobacteria bacterium]
MAPQYRLETLLDLRKRAEEAAKNEFAEAQKALAAQKAELRRLTDDLAQRRADRKRKVDAYLKEMLSKGMGAMGVQGMGSYDKRLRAEEAEVEEQIEVQKERVAEAEDFAEQKRAALAEAAKEVKAIEKHKEKFLKQKKAEREAREDLAGEEIGNALFLARQRNNEK